MIDIRRLLRRQPEPGVDDQQPPCPICLHLRKWDRYHRRPLRPVQRQTHHVSSVNYDMCREHFEIVSAHVQIEIALTFCSPEQFVKRETRYDDI